MGRMVVIPAITSGLALVICLRQGAVGTYDVLDDGPLEPGAEIRLTLAAPGGTDQ
ncbi:hypothetical protein VB636_07030 [Paracoccus sp. APAP_BH8]|uniref:hypothetical protein n=1 Tax=Paracoccus sp. APAP_BH8 TaxID=3110237 RepID=UPI002FD878C6